MAPAEKPQAPRAPRASDRQESRSLVKGDASLGKTSMHDHRSDQETTRHARVRGTLSLCVALLLSGGCAGVGSEARDPSHDGRLNETAPHAIGTDDSGHSSGSGSRSEHHTRSRDHASKSGKGK
jgi:hypothetical protein